MPDVLDATGCEQREVGKRCVEDRMGRRVQQVVLRVCMSLQDTLGVRVSDVWAQGPVRRCFEVGVCSAVGRCGGVPMWLGTQVMVGYAGITDLAAQG